MHSQPALLTRLDDDLRTIVGIDEDGTRFPIGKMEAHRRGVLHDAVSVFLFDGDEMLLQRRAVSKYHCGGLWANACCTHPDWDEDGEKSARRRLFEELGLHLTRLQQVGQTTYRAAVGNGLIEHERVRLFSAEVNRQGLSFTLNPQEVSEIRWVNLTDLQREVDNDPARFAPWLRIYLQRWDRLGLRTV